MIMMNGTSQRKNTKNAVEMNKNLKRMLLFINLIFLNWLLMVTVHELNHISVTEDLKEVCVLGYNKKLNTVGWTEGIAKETGLYDKQDNIYWILTNVVQFLILTVIIGIVIKHKT